MNIVSHPIPPVWREDATVLILGSFPSVKSREGKFYYHHPQNRFWKVLSAVYAAPAMQTVEEKKAFLLTHNIAIWDSIQSCQIDGSEDSTIRDVTPNDIAGLLAKTNIKQIFCNGNVSYNCYCRYILPKTSVPAIKLPSTSPANAAWSTQRLTEAWKCIRDVQEMSENSIQTEKNLIYYKKEN